MSITKNATDRATGLVYLDAARASAPATHVFIIGVGNFLSSNVKSVTSPPKSALAMASWFLGRDGGPGFVNHERPLGSLAMMISDEKAGAETIYEGAPVPRAKFELVRAGVQAWVTRINSNKDNLAIFYVCSHGESFGTKTAFLLEEYDTNELQKTVGLSEIKQLADALLFAKPVRQLLLVDCCRTESGLQLPPDEQFGEKFISLTKPADDHGESRQQWICGATTLGEELTGRKNTTTIFTDGLLRCLKGAAADGSGGDWRVTPADLIRTLPRFMDLHRRPREELQKPNGTFADAFPICFCKEPTSVQTYVALNDQSRWPGCRVTIKGAQEQVFNIAQPPGPDRFAVAEVEELQAIEVVVADNKGDEIGREMRAKPRVPAEYIVIGANKIVSVQTRPSQQLGGPDNTAICVRSYAPANLPDAGIMRLTRIDGASRMKLPPALINLNQSDQITAIEPGTYHVALRMPDGKFFSTTVDAVPDNVVDIAIAGRASPHEWLAGAIATGLVATTDDDKLPAHAPQWEVAATQVELVQAMQQIGWISQPPPNKTIRDPVLQISPEPDYQERFRGFRLFRTWAIGQRPAWVQATLGHTHELCAIPLNKNTSVSLVVDRMPPEQSAASSVAIEGRWTPLVGYLATRNFAAGEIVFGASASEIRLAVERKFEDAFAAVIGAAIAVGSGRFEKFAIDERWLRNLSQYFPGIPDGPIILARHLQARMRTTKQRAEVRNLFMEAYNRGPPVLSLSLEWLDAGLAQFGEKGSAKLRRAARSVSRIAVRLDPSKPFTTIRLGPEGRIV